MFQTKPAQRNLSGGRGRAVGLYSLLIGAGIAETELTIAAAFRVAIYNVARS